MHFVHRPQERYESDVKNTLGQGSTNPRHLVVQQTFCKVAHNIFCVIIAVFPLHTKMCTSSHAPSIKRQMTMKFTGHSRTVCPVVWSIYISWTQHPSYDGRIYETRQANIRCITQLPSSVTN
jgi:hypothetical protein